MAKIARVFQKVFAKNASNNGQIGSLQVGTRIDSNDLTVLQALSAFDNGLNEVIVGGEQVIPLEEMQALSYIATKQLAYLFQEGIPEYDASTEYFTYSIVKKPNTYQIWGSKIDNNIGNALTAGANWQFLQDLSNPSVSFLWCGVATGTANALVLTPASAITAYAAGRPIEFIPASNNAAGAVTVNISGLGARSLAKGAITTFGANEFKAGKMVLGIDDGTNIQIVNSPAFARGVDIASASTINLDTATGDIIDITGVTNIANMTLAEGEFRILRFVNALTLQNTGNMVLQGGANIVTAGGDFIIAIGYPMSAVRILYFRADGTALIGPVVASNIEMQTAAILTKFGAPGNLLMHPGVAKKWISFKGTASTTIYDSFGISALTRISTGYYQIDFVTPFATDYYTVEGLAKRNSSGVLSDDANVKIANISGNPQAGTCRIVTTDNSGNPFDMELVTLTFHGRH